VTNLKIGLLSKSGRGYALANSDKSALFTAERIALRPNLSSSEAFQIIARACVQHFRLNEALLVKNGSVQALHQSRIAIRRLRSALSLFKPMVRGQKYKRLKKRLRSVSHQFGEARNLDVYVAQTTAPEAGRQFRPTLLSQAVHIQEARDQAYDNVLNTLQSERFHHFMQELDAWIQQGRWRTSDKPRNQAARKQKVEEFAATALKKGRHELKRHGRHLKRLSPEERHRFRIGVKKLRYACECFSGLSIDAQHRKRYQTFIATLGQLQSRLGDLNDIQNANEIESKQASHKRVPGRKSRDRNKNDQGQRIDELLVSACEAYQRFSDAQPFWNKQSGEDRDI